MTIGITGARGFVGGRLAAMASAAGHSVVGYSRSSGPGWRTLVPGSLPDFQGVDAVVHLAGEPILGLWTRGKRERILASRVVGTRQVVEGLAATHQRPRVLVCASAIGYYGNPGEQCVDESSPAGTGFLAQVAQAWEDEAVKAAALGIRVVRLRIGFVLGHGGAMKLMLPAFRMGLGGKLGDGRQWMSVIHVDDVAGMALRAVTDDSLSGPINAVVPEPVRNADFTAAVAKAVRRPAILPAPAPLLRIGLGDLSHVMLDSLRVLPKAAIQAGYQYHYPSLQSAVAASV